MEQTRDRHQNHGGEYRLRQRAQEMGEKQHDHQDKNRSESSGERCLRTAIFIDERLRCAAAHWKATTESGAQVRRRQGPIFLISIESSAALRGEHPADRGRFDCAEKKASQGQWK